MVVDNHFNFVYPKDQCKMLEKFRECGYYIMQWMTTIVRACITTNWKTIIYI